MRTCFERDRSMYKGVLFFNLFLKENKTEPTIMFCLFFLTTKLPLLQNVYIKQFARKCMKSVFHVYQNMCFSCAYKIH